MDEMRVVAGCADGKLLEGFPVRHLIMELPCARDEENDRYCTASLNLFGQPSKLNRQNQNKIKEWKIRLPCHPPCDSK